MFKALLAKHTKKSIASPQRIKLDDNCEDYITSYLTKTTLTANKKYCLSSTGFFIIGSKGAKISYEKEDGTFTAQTSDALGAVSYVNDDGLVSRKYQIIVPGDQQCYFVPAGFYSTSSSEEYEEYTINTEVKYYACLKKNFEGKISTLYKINGKVGTTKAVGLGFYNPNGATISANNGDNAITYYNDDELTETKSNEIYGIFAVEIKNEPDEDKDGEWPLESTVTIKGNDGDIALPEKLFELTADTIYTTSTADATIADMTDDDDGGLSAGAIAGIVIACVVVVGGIAGFCVYWFMFRNKSDADAPQA